MKEVPGDLFGLRMERLLGVFIGVRVQGLP
jgi:hypothetical protein